MKGERRRGGIYIKGSNDYKFDFESQGMKLAFHWKEMGCVSTKEGLRLGQNGPNAGIKAASRKDAKLRFTKGQKS